MSLARLRTVKLVSPGAVCFLMLVALFLPGCASRYRVELFLTRNYQRMEVKVEKSEYHLGAVLGDPLAENKIVPGDGNCLVIVTGSRGQTLDSGAKDLVSFDRYDRYRIFLQLPSKLTPDTLPLAGISFVQLMGRYEVELEDKMYLPTEGDLMIDSLSGDRLFGGIDGRFVNRLQEPVDFQGQFKVKVAD